MVFGSEVSNQTHWKKLFEQDNKGSIIEFRDYILKRLSLDTEKWADCWNKMVGFGNQFVVHRELEFNKPMPYFDFAYKVALLFDLWIGEKIKPDFLDFETHEQISLRYRGKVRDTLMIVRVNSKN